MPLSIDAISHFATRRAGWLLALVLAITAAGAAQIFDPVTHQLRLTVDPSIDAMLPEDDADRKYYEHIRRLFGSDETVLIALMTDDVFSRESLDRVVRKSLARILAITQHRKQLNGRGKINNDSLRITHFPKIIKVAIAIQIHIDVDDFPVGNSGEDGDFG